MGTAWRRTRGPGCWRMADRTGLTAFLGDAVGVMRQRRSGQDPGRVLVDLAVMLADGGRGISGLAVLRDRPELFGSVASTATAWRVLDGIDPAVLAEIRTARARAGNGCGSSARRRWGRSGP